MNCPAGCSTPLVMSERQNVEIDYCPTCRGVWLDRGELDKILERSMDDSPPRDATTSTPPPAMRDDRSTEQPPKKKKRTSFLQDLFEFGE